MNSSPARRRAVIVAVAVMALVGGLAAAADETVVVRVFRLRFADLSHVSAVIQPLLSGEGSLTVQPGKRVITVRDRAAVVNRVGEVIAKLDVEPESFRLRIDLLAGYSAEASIPRGDVVDARLKRMFPFDAYRRLDSVLLEGEVGSDIVVDLEEGYRIRVRVGDHRVEDLPYGLPDSGLRLDLQPFVLERVHRGVVTEVIGTRVILSVNQEVVIGAGGGEESDRGLVLIVKALAEGAR
jgi:hypothetical protein